MNRRSLLAITITALALGAVGCGPPWQIVVQAASDPFLGQGKFVVAPIDFTGLHIGEKSEAEYISGKDDKQAASFAEDKVGINEAFTRGLIDKAHSDGIQIDLATGPQDGPFVIRASVQFVEPGFYAYVASKPSAVEMDVKITTPDGRILDEIALTHRTAATLTNPSSGGRLRDDGHALGVIVARYIHSRVAP